MPVDILVDLNGQEFAARACGGCSGSSSGNKISAKVDDVRAEDSVATRYRKIREIFADVDAHDPFQDPQCGNCTNVGICGGKLYCKPDPCDFLPFDMEEFLRFFVGAYPAAPNKFDLGLSV